MILETFQLPPLLGYSGSSPTDVTHVELDTGSDLLVVVDPEVPLADIARPVDRRDCRRIPFSFNWTLVDGVNVEPRAGRRGHTPKCLDPGRAFAPPIVEKRIFGDVADGGTCVGDVLGGDFRSYFEHAVELFYGDDEAQLALVASLRTDAGIQPLLPLFLQSIAERLVEGLHDTEIVRRIGFVTVALLPNTSLPIQFYVHVFARTVMTIVLRYENGDSVEDDVEARRFGARALIELCDRCSSGFPEIRTVALNALLGTWFDPAATHAAQFGALIGICAFGDAAVRTLIGHLAGSVVALKRELRLGDTRKRPFIRLILDEVGRILEEHVKGFARQELMKMHTVLNEVISIRKSLDGAQSTA
jgi:hypothetical protein